MTSESLATEERDIEIGDRVVLKGETEVGEVVDVYADPTAPERIFARVEFPGRTFQSDDETGRSRNVKMPPSRIALAVHRLRRVDDDEGQSVA